MQLYLHSTLACVMSFMFNRLCSKALCQNWVSIGFLTCFILQTFVLLGNFTQHGYCHYIGILLGYLLDDFSRCNFQMKIHHMITAVITTSSVFMPTSAQYYALLIGLEEISTVFLTLREMKMFSGNAKLINDICFSGSFLVLRPILGTYTMIIIASQLPSFYCVGIISFLLLQYYWGYKIIRMMYRKFLMVIQHIQDHKLRMLVCVSRFIFTS